MVNPTEAKEVAVYFISQTNGKFDGKSIRINTSIAKKLLENYPKESILYAIDLYKDKMFSMNFLKCVIEEVHQARLEVEKEQQIKSEIERQHNELTIFKESDVNGSNSNTNREKLQRRNSISRKRKSYPDALFKQQ